MPATFSRLIVDDYLRGQVGYRGVIVSDDLEMGAIARPLPDRRGDGAHRRGGPRSAPRLPHRAGAARRARRRCSPPIGAGALPVAVARAERRAPRRARGPARRRASTAGRRALRRTASRWPGPSPRARSRVVTPLPPGLPAEPERARRRGVPAPVRPRRPHHDRAGDAGRGAITCARRWRPTASRPRCTWSAWSRPRPRSATREHRAAAADAMRAVPVRRASLRVEPRAAGRAPGRGPRPGRRADARPVRRRASPPDIGSVTAYGWRRCQLDAALARLLS